ARSYPTLGTLWDAFGTQPVTWISEDAFVNALRRAADAWEGAAPAAPLALGDIRPINYLEPPPSGCTAEISYAPSFA
ncbi:hypothetical protein ACPXA0_26430, partial [Escherichia coli]|uniref:hypothetical protein n=1 Tax=Escherichia coli TaxID=562 RepID=UPI003CE47019